MNRVVAYVDGFNLYFGLKEGYGRWYHWFPVTLICVQWLPLSSSCVRINGSSWRFLHGDIPRH